MHLLFEQNDKVTFAENSLTFILSWLSDVDESGRDLSLESSCFDDENEGLGMDHLYTCTVKIINMSINTLCCIKKECLNERCNFMIVEDQGY